MAIIELKNCVDPSTPWEMLQHSDHVALNVTWKNLSPERQKELREITTEQLENDVRLAREENRKMFTELMATLSEKKKNGTP